MALLYFVQNHDENLLSFLLAITEHKSHLNQNKNFQAGWILFFGVYFPILSSKDDISFRHELGSANIKFDRLNRA